VDEDVETSTKFDKQLVEQTQYVDEDVETDTEFERDQVEQAGEFCEDAQGGNDEDVVVVGVTGSNETHTASTKEMGPTIAASECILLSDDEDIDHQHFSDDDDDADGVPKTIELKPVIAPSSMVVKVEKDWWKKDQEARRRGLSDRRNERRRRGCSLRHLRPTSLQMIEFLHCLTKPKQSTMSLRIRWQCSWMP